MKRYSPLIILFIFLLDQATKLYIVSHANLWPQTITPFFNVILTWNRGMSFGILNSSSNLIFWTFTTIVIGIIGYAVYLLIKEKKPFIILALSLILGGAFGNLADRLYRGGVVDFLDFHFQEYAWPAFNIADSFIVLGVTLFLWSVGREK